MTDPKAKFKKYVGAESGGGRPEGKGYITRTPEAETETSTFRSDCD